MKRRSVSECIGPCRLVKAACSVAMHEAATWYLSDVYGTRALMSFSDVRDTFRLVLLVYTGNGTASYGTAPCEFRVAEGFFRIARPHQLTNRRT